MENRSRNTNQARSRRTVPGGSRTWLFLTNIVIILLLVACQGTTTPVVETPVTEEPTEEPSGEPVVIPCEGSDGNYTCPGLDGHTITFADVPADVTPALLEVSEQREEELLAAATENTGCIFVIVGDVVFYDQDNNLIEEPKFSEPVTLMFDFSAADMENFEACKARITVEEGATIKHLPVYYHQDVWRPFEEGKYEVDADNRVTIKFTAWGDQPIGGGTQP